MDQRIHGQEAQFKIFPLRRDFVLGLFVGLMCSLLKLAGKSCSEYVPYGIASAIKALLVKLKPAHNPPDWAPTQENIISDQQEGSPSNTLAELQKCESKAFELGHY